MHALQTAVLSIFIGIQLIAFSCGAPKEFVDFYQLPQKERSQKFRTFAIEKQLDYHLLAMAREPSDYTFSEEIARQGDVVLPAVLRRMEWEKEDSRKVNVIVILSDFCRLEDCKKNKPEIIEAVEKQISSIRSPAWRGIAEQLLSAMKGNPVPLPEIR